MDPQQQAAFRNANPGSPVTEADLLALCAGLVCALVVLWCAWVVLHAYKQWSGGGTSIADAVGPVFRAVFLTMVLLAIVTW